MNDVVVITKVPATSVAVPEVETLSTKEQLEYTKLLNDAHHWQGKGLDAMRRFGASLRDIKASALVTKRHGDGGWKALVEREFGLGKAYADRLISFARVQDALLNAPEVPPNGGGLTKVEAPAVAKQIIAGLSEGAAREIAPVVLPAGGEATPASVAEATKVLTKVAADNGGKVTAKGIRAERIKSTTPKATPLEWMVRDIRAVLARYASEADCVQMSAAVEAVLKGGGATANP